MDHHKNQNQNKSPSVIPGYVTIDEFDTTTTRKHDCHDNDNQSDRNKRVKLNDNNDHDKRYRSDDGHDDTHQHKKLHMSTTMINVYLWMNNLVVACSERNDGLENEMKKYFHDVLLSTHMVTIRFSGGHSDDGGFGWEMTSVVNGIHTDLHECSLYVITNQPQDNEWYTRNIFPLVNNTEKGSSLVFIRLKCDELCMTNGECHVDDVLRKCVCVGRCDDFTIREGAHYDQSKCVPSDHVIDMNMCYFVCSKILGSGGFGTVYHGGIRNGMEVAVKKPKRRFKQFQYECLLHESMHHCNIVPVVGRSEKTLVLKYCHGGTLKSWIVMNRDSLSMSLLWRGCVELSSALVYMHDKGIIHRDIKVTNIMVDEKGHWYFADLGLGARSRVLLHGDEDSNVNLAKYFKFASPEEQRLYSTVTAGVVTGYPEPLSESSTANKDNRFSKWREHVTSKSDMFTFGFVLWYIYCGGSRDFWSNGRMSKGDIEKVILGKHPRQVTIEDCHDMSGSMFSNDDRIRVLIRDCWQNDPSLRPSAQELLDRLLEMRPRSHEDTNVILNHKLRTQLFNMSSHRHSAVYIEPWCSDHEIVPAKWWTQNEDFVSEQRVYPVRQVLHDFINERLPPPSTGATRDGSDVLVLMGDGGVGKTTTLIDFSRSLMNGGGEWLVVLLRPMLERLYSELNGDSLIDGITRVLGSHGLNEHQIEWMRQHKVVFILDGIDEVKDRDKIQQNIPSLLGMNTWPSSKLIISCRPSGLEYRHWFSVFGVDCVFEFVLPFTPSQIEEYLKTSEEHCVDQFVSHMLNAKLSNPYLLYLLIQSSPSLSEFRRVDVYRVSMIKWIKDCREIVDECVNIDSLVTHSLLSSPNDVEGDTRSLDVICDELELGAARMALAMFESNVISLSSNDANVAELWRRSLVCDTIRSEALSVFDGKSSNEKDDLLDREQFGRLVETCVGKWRSLCPLEYREDGSWAFFHKSFQDWGVAMFLYREGVHEVSQRVHDDFCVLGEAWWGGQVLSRLSLDSKSDMMMFVVEFVDVVEVSQWSMASSSTTFTSYLWRLIEAQCRLKKTLDSVNSSLSKLVMKCGENAMLILSSAR